MQTLSETPRDASRDGRSVTRAWISLAVIPLFLILAMAVGEGLYALFGYEPSEAPFWPNLAASIPALLVMLVPTVTAVFYGWRAHQVGDRRAIVPAVLALLIGLWFTVLTVIGLAAGPL